MIPGEHLEIYDAHLYSGRSSSRGGSGSAPKATSDTTSRVSPTGGSTFMRKRGGDQGEEWVSTLAFPI